MEDDNQYINFTSTQHVTNAILNDQFSCCQLDPQMCLKYGEPSPSESTGVKCNDWHQKKMQLRLTEAKRLNSPLLISEFGNCFDTDACVREIQQVMDQCEDNLCAGWTFSQFKDFQQLDNPDPRGLRGLYTENGELQQGKAYVLSRPYILQIPGTLKSSLYDHDLRQFNAVFKLKMRYNQPTQAIIFVNQAYYFPNGFDTIIKKYHN